MSAEAARVFLATLRHLEQELEIPLPERVRILREIECDLEALVERLVSQGVPTDAARARAIETLVPEGVALRELGALHMPAYRRASGRWGDTRVRLVERTALVVAMAVVLATSTLGLLRADLLADPSPFLWPVLGMGAVSFAAIARTFFELLVKGEHRRSGLGLRSIRWAAAVTLGLGFGGTVFDLHRLAVLAEASPHLTDTLAVTWAIRDAALLSVSITIALTCGLAWFVLTQWLTAVRVAHRAVLGLEPVTRYPKR